MHVTRFLAKDLIRFTAKRELHLGNTINKITVLNIPGSSHSTLFPFLGCEEVNFMGFTSVLFFLHSYRRICKNQWKYLTDQCISWSCLQFCDHDLAVHTRHVRLVARWLLTYTHWEQAGWNMNGRLPLWICHCTTSLFALPRATTTRSKDRLVGVQVSLPGGGGVLQEWEEGVYCNVKLSNVHHFTSSTSIEICYSSWVIIRYRL
jgi:hypothetical protein